MTTQHTRLTRDVGLFVVKPYLSRRYSIASEIRY